MDIRARLHYMTLTNTYMEGQAKFNPKASHGFSKEKRYDGPFGVMGLVMNEHGFLSRTSILPANTTLAKNSGNNDQKP